ncbi:MAG: Hsp20/alpha crystallin family protein [Pigeon pea little leaf phytoplasma]|uniref:Hsp20/alpha crystallin family protein n=1 Tax=Candidatus Phytoplasma fabacearum TaxID=2982628 RepID=A0ABU8ZSN6_9MOLU|nr:Hsp20/alpha crystallin family protein ['Bituminaria bituminosa' little leaf phytoplasma]MDV3148748.1 Hsp20/alpha crystallin family protein [Pigeon pea little leaf phytoplasma]MDO7983640.1 Hsp20/alpha crystallin family protein ['Bituminaria bituminosa' little leaf phytoplasma]MDO8024037.1 Hsp20/alpha crystallin family protein ['Bituminaria bituminosa' little leaf phytoplasma]MDO8030449.1 Hsp20/alpha crystallin family protein ['Bituminaria bituminosa' little leaf phytoplasma]MDV3154214.1 Hsp2
MSLIKDLLSIPTILDLDKRLPKADLWDCQDYYLLIMDLPGFTKEQVKISVNEGRLTIEADNRCPQTNNNKQSVNKKDSDATKENNPSNDFCCLMDNCSDCEILYQERFYGKIERTFNYNFIHLTSVKDIEGKLENGLLKLKISKKTQIQSNKEFVQLK